MMGDFFLGGVGSVRVYATWTEGEIRLVGSGEEWSELHTAVTPDPAD